MDTFTHVIHGCFTSTGAIYCRSASEATLNDIDSLMQKRRNSSALAMELRLFCIKPSTWSRLT